LAFLGCQRGFNENPGSPLQSVGDASANYNVKRP
jgi:hypothetical protein